MKVSEVDVEALMGFGVAEAQKRSRQVGKETSRQVDK